MKTQINLLLFILLLINIFELSAQDKKDTIFIVNKNNETEKHFIYIDPDVNSYNYNRLSNFNDFPNFNQKNRLVNLKLQEKWVPLYLYKNQYYLYIPCDRGPENKIYLTKKEFIIDGHEFIKYKISSNIKKYNDSHFCLILKNNIFKDSTTLNIYIIDKLKGIAIFKYLNNSNIIKYQLMVDSNNLKQFEIIVNDCVNEKTSEFIFDKIKFEKLILEIDKN